MSPEKSSTNESMPLVKFGRGSRGVGGGGAVSAVGGLFSRSLSCASSQQAAALDLMLNDKYEGFVSTLVDKSYERVEDVER